jgi:UDP-glucose 4-epimerase
MNIIVSGCTGFIGSNLVTKLLNSGFVVKGIAKNASKSFYPIYNVDLQNLDSLKKIKADNIDVVVHLAAKTDELDLLTMFTNNVISTINLLEYSVSKKIKKFIFISGQNVYSQNLKLPIREDYETFPNTNYGITKLIAEQCVQYYSKKFNLKVIILRVSYTYGQNQKQNKMIAKIINCYKKSNTIFLHKYKNGFQKIDFIHVSDVCDAIINSIKAKNICGVYNIASGKPHTILDLISIMKKIRKTKSKILIKKVNSKTNHAYFNIKQAKKNLKFYPKISLDVGLTDFFN